VAGITEEKIKHMTTFLFVIFVLVGQSYGAHVMGPQLLDHITQKEKSKEVKSNDKNFPSSDCAGFTAKYRKMGLTNNEMAKELYIDAFIKSFDPSAVELAKKLARCSSALANNGDENWPIEKKGFLR
jgi:hypothetical protein